VANKNNCDSRRAFLRKAGGLLLASGIGIPQVLRAQSTFSNPVGYAAISWPSDQFDDAIVDISALGFRGVQMLGSTLKSYGSRVETLKARLDILKLKPAALSCSGVSPNPARASNDSAQFKRYVAFMKHLGGKNLQITDGGRPGRNYSAREIRTLGAHMNELGKLARSSGLVMGYHPHFGTLGETRKGLGKVLGATSPKDVKLIADVARLTLGGCDPAEVIRSYHDRLLFVHFKDVRKDVLAQARRNRNLVRKSHDLFCVIGQGGVDFPPILKALRDTHFSGWVIVELGAYKVPPGGPAVSARMNLEAMRRMGFKV